MTHIPVQLPFKGFTEQAAYSTVPQGMTPSCLNVMPSDVWHGRTRIGTRNGTRLYNAGAVQFMGTYRVYEGTQLVEKLIFVRGGKVYYSDPRGDVPVTPTLFGDGTTQTTALLKTTGLVEGVQFNEHFYFVDGTNYVFVKLTTPAAATAVAIWGDASGPHGPYRTDPSNPQDGERATLICRWGARLVLAGYKRTPNIWYACEPDQPYAKTGSPVGGSPIDGWTGSKWIGAIGGASGTEYGTLGDPIVAIFPFAQSGLMFACTNSFSFLTNDPVFEEQVAMVNLTKSIGIAGQRAFCQSQEKGAFILANDGLYFINANENNFNRGNRVSAGRLDSFFLRLDFGTPAIGGTGPLAGGTLRSIVAEDGSASGAKTETVTTSGTLSSEATAEPFDATIPALGFLGTQTDGNVFPCLCYDPDREGVWILLSVKGTESASLHLYYDLKTDSFWPQRFSDPVCYAPTSACYVGTSRTDSGRLFLGSGDAISMIERSFPIGVDGWVVEMDPENQRKQFVRSSLTVGPIIAPLPNRLLVSEVRVDLADDKYELPESFGDVSEPPILTASSGDTAQSALGLQTDTLFVINLNPLVIDGGNAAGSGPTPLYDGGDIAAPSPNNIDGRFAVRPFGQFKQNDPFSEGTARTYDGPADWTLRYNTAPNPDLWTIAKFNGASWDTEYEQVDPDPATPDGMMVCTTQVPVSPDIKDNASVSGASFPEASVTEIGTIVAGRNTAQKCRIRAEAVYMTIASDGRPWAVERMSVQVMQVGKSRGGV